MTIKFLRTGSRTFMRLGKNRRKKEKWRRARGRHNKIREKRKSRQRKVEIGYRTRKKERGKIKGKEIVFVKNFKDLEKVKKNSLVLIAKFGKKKRKLIEEKIKEIGAKILNLRKENIEGK